MIPSWRRSISDRSRIIYIVWGPFERGNLNPLKRVKSSLMDMDHLLFMLRLFTLMRAFYPRARSAIWRHDDQGNEMWKGFGNVAIFPWFFEESVNRRWWKRFVYDIRYKVNEICIVRCGDSLWKSSFVWNDVVNSSRNLNS